MLYLIALGRNSDVAFPVIGEVKAYEKDPLGGFAKACEKFTQVRDGEYDDEIRDALKRELDIHKTFTKQQLADCIWIEKGRFGALVGYDQKYELGEDVCCDREEILKQDSARLYFVTSPYKTMRTCLQNLSELLVTLAERLGE